MKKKIALYIFLFVVCLAILNVLLLKYFSRNVQEITANPIGVLEPKLLHYKANKAKYKIVFVGDSRTYCNVYNAVVDSVLGIESMNLSRFANWFPTQYPFLQDLLPEIPDSTVLIWSIGHQNFTHSTEFKDLVSTYAIKMKDVPEYMAWGFTLPEMRENLINSHGKSVLFFRQEWLHSLLKNYLDKKLAVFGTFTANQNLNSRGPLHETAFRLINEVYANNPHVSLVKERTSGDTITSAEVFMKEGNYVRVEIDSLFFRQQQEKDRAERMAKKFDGEFKRDDRYWNNFLAIIRELDKHKSRLRIVINEFEEAPYVYRPGEKKATEEFMYGIREYLTKKGYPYLKADFTNYPNELYFDYNHMNSVGARKYSLELAGLIKQVK